MSIENQLVQYFDEWEQSLPPDARAALRPLFDQARSNEAMAHWCPECVGQGIDTDPPEPGRDDTCKACGGSGLRKSVTVTEKRNLYTCLGKGGEYELLGVAYGAGTSRGTIVTLYRDVDTGVMYFRTQVDFDERMQKIDVANGGKNDT